MHDGHDDDRHHDHHDHHGQQGRRVGASYSIKLSQGHHSYSSIFFLRQRLRPMRRDPPWVDQDSPRDPLGTCSIFKARSIDNSATKRVGADNKHQTTQRRLFTFFLFFGKALYAR